MNSIVSLFLLLAAALLGCAPGHLERASEVASDNVAEAPAKRPTLAMADGATSSVFTWATPPGWRSETMPFPLSFAPSLPYGGVEELRFAPHFFDQTADTYFTYSFAWVLEPTGEGVVPFTAEQFASDLRTYFAGLASAVSKSPLDPSAHHAEVLAVDTARYAGTVQTVDAFGGGRALTLHIEGESSLCAGRRGVVTSLSPRAPNDAIWHVLAKQRKSFQCRSSANG